jgi:hypothetical protein
MLQRQTTIGKDVGSGETRLAQCSERQKLAGEAQCSRDRRLVKKWRKVGSGETADGLLAGRRIVVLRGHV